ncbi:MAG: hypothetical protein A2725_00100 [Candidatus Magasanikbacteria bacterium RIFCSPHIGHO2_01_FULL_33_34]|uniref:Uncharacterized protein n=1 Tax=Candidatus Magasanikbacteria bacterium RIFCSPHIGHO2_01_FULL_33_34 TaxID=1798671 RepID=A0A1F6LL32_9BACT|nr:MAG: hypothetical protein A2725_00100 [Candidatus Magasanikbacteria bacterium RIFCSPHIGHO2_01_FULL_33_34]OGH65762.1 MAG: hypothetical protein A3B83_02770 [Candidatus Magasanikbacteria bacterium RIFCSPHIGHO2_02_FULL_33_17]OGH75128.1 MAG: hypothetical protein A3A89_03365 [Candidatus Magasanikbacteria bacterium RIFCSPLOWO2_01_FULL_33_34]OGH81206.1 MAG: hypothetical protein A3F93_04065 [Candidatus Magasanikbacteria bacterium RIFCSPLOWO2_12_FULL_34_7]
MTMMKFKKHHELSAYHKYQLEIIFLYAVGIFLFLPYYLILDEFNLSKIEYQWYFFWPFITFYTIYSLYTRNKINDAEKINPHKRNIIYWILFGLSILFIQIQPSTLNHLKSLDLSFLVLSLFLADSYWDFKKIRLFNK